MEPEGSLPHSQYPANELIWLRIGPEPDQSSKRSHPISLISVLILCSHVGLALQSGLLPPGLHTKSFYTPLPSHRATVPAHLTLFLNARSYACVTCKVNIFRLISSIVLSDGLLHLLLFFRLLCLWRSLLHDTDCMQSVAWCQYHKCLHVDLADGGPDFWLVFVRMFT
jgi:hypothetical protein